MGREVVTGRIVFRAASPPTVHRTGSPQGAAAISRSEGRRPVASAVMPALLTAVDYARLPSRARTALEHGRLRRLPQGPPDRRIRALRVAALLGSAAEALDGFASCELVVRRSRDPDTARRPDCCVVLGDPPPDGVLDGAPTLVVEFPPTGEPAWWLAAGTEAVWLLDADGAVVHEASGRVSRVPARDPDAELAVPGHPALRLRLADLDRPSRR